MKKWQEKPFIKMIFALNAGQLGIKDLKQIIMTIKIMKFQKRFARNAEIFIKIKEKIDKKIQRYIGKVI